MSTTLSLEEGLSMPVGELAERSALELYHLRLDAIEAAAAARDCAAYIDRALELKYSALAQDRRLAIGKDTGVVHFDDGPVRITADLPKRIRWDQAQLREIVNRIAAGGEDPSEFVSIEYHVDERKYTAWPRSLQAAFDPARTVETGKPGFRLALMREGGAS